MGGKGSGRIDREEVFLEIASRVHEGWQRHEGMARQLRYVRRTLEAVTALVDALMSQNEQETARHRGTYRMAVTRQAS